MRYRRKVFFFPTPELHSRKSFPDLAAAGKLTLIGR
jgi:hypothetical protein